MPDSNLQGKDRVDTPLITEENHLNQGGVITNNNLQITYQANTNNHHIGYSN